MAIEVGAVSPATSRTRAVPPAWHTGLRSFVRNRLALTGGILLGFVLMAMLVTPLLTKQSPLAVHPAERLLVPGGVHPLGTDEFGRDVMSRLLYGARLSLVVGALVMALSAAVGILIGLVAGFYRSWDGLLMRTLDGFMAFPSVLLAIALMAFLGASARNVIMALTLAYMPRLARVVRAQVLAVKELAFVEAARAVGASDRLILFRNILPNCLSAILVQATAIFAYAILAEATLSFLGVGAPPEIPSWGVMLSEGRNYMAQAPWLTIFPGLAIMATVLGLNLLGDGLRDVLDPRNR